MKKRALLFGYNGSHENGNFLPGVRNDINRSKAFLLSDLGGQWSNREIFDKVNPSRSEIDNWIDESENCDYSLIIYSGHGGKDENGRLHIDLNDKESMRLFELPRHNKQLMIVDACRSNMDEDEIAVGNVLLESDLRRPATSRMIYEKAIAVAESGRVIIYATQDDQPAEDSVFLNILFDRCEEWEDSQSGLILNASKAYSLCHEFMEELNRLGECSQMPQIAGSIKRNRHFPFAINASQQSYNIKASELLSKLKP